jgi:hypothetical protein
LISADGQALNAASKSSKKFLGFNSIFYSAASFIQLNICLYFCLDLSSKNENTQADDLNA